MIDTTKGKGKAYAWVSGKDDINKARISYILKEQRNGHYPTAVEIINKIPSGRAFFAIGTLLQEGLENGTIKRKENGYFIDDEMLPEVKTALGIE